MKNEKISQPMLKIFEKNCWKLTSIITFGGCSRCLSHSSSRLPTLATLSSISWLLSLLHSLIVICHVFLSSCWQKLKVWPFLAFSHCSQKILAKHNIWCYFSSKIVHNNHIMYEPFIGPINEIITSVAQQVDWWERLATPRQIKLSCL